MSDSLNPQENPAKDPADWTTGDEPMTGPQKSYLQTLAREAGRDVKLDGLSKDALISTSVCAGRVA